MDGRCRVQGNSRPAPLLPDLVHHPVKMGAGFCMDREDVYKRQVLGYIDHTITVNIIKNDKIVEKRALRLPHKITNVVQCKNPRCITSIEQELPHIFYLADEKTETYRCQYCEEKYSGN